MNDSVKSVTPTWQAACGKRVTAATVAGCLALLVGCGGSTDDDESVSEIRSLSNRADLVSGGDVLVEVVIPEGINLSRLRATLNGTNVASQFSRKSDGRVTALLDGLREGENALTASIEGRRSVSLKIINHPKGGPVFSGPQLEPWLCTTEAVGLGPPIDAQCNANVQYRFLYKSAADGKFNPYDPNEPPTAVSIAKTTTDQGKTVPYILRIETGTLNRSIYDVAVLFDPSKPAEALAAWNGKLHYVFGCAGGVNRSQAINRACPFFSPTVDEQLLLSEGGPDYAVSRGYMTAVASLTNNGNNVNVVLQAETLMMVKERIVENYGPIRFTMGLGSSGGSMTQHGISNQYPGLIDGIRPSNSFPDWWTITAFNGVDCTLLVNYFDNAAPSLWPNPAARDAVTGFGQYEGDSGLEFCRTQTSWGTFWDPMSNCVPEPQRYNAVSNPTGVRCTNQDHLVNVLGRREQPAWGPVEQKIGRGFANRFLDRVGVQYGFKALASGAITPDQFIDLNEKIGGWDIDRNFQAQRSVADLPALEAMYRTGQLVQGRELANVPIIDYRFDTRMDVHSNRNAELTRQRLLKSTGSDANRARWIGPRADATPQNPAAGYFTEYIPLGEPTFVVMDEWLTNIEKDVSNASRAEKIIRNRPSSAADGCFAAGVRVNDAVCAGYKLDEDPMLVAGQPATRDILKCQLKPLRQSDYTVQFTAEQWSRLSAVFSEGVCDWSKPSVGDTQNVTWLTFENGPGGKALGAAPQSTRD